VTLADGIAGAADTVSCSTATRGRWPQAALGDAVAMWRRRHDQAARSAVGRVWSLCRPPHGPDLAHHNVFFAPIPRRIRPLAAADAGDPTLYVCAEDRGSPAPPPQGSNASKSSERAADRPGRPPAKEPKHVGHDLSPLARFGLSFRPRARTAALTTPDRVSSACFRRAGSLYGQSPHGMLAAFQRPTARHADPGLYLAGGGTHPGAGVPMATLSGGTRPRRS
jgi:1-hydroxycarotenoid 3,4-desaturase